MANVKYTISFITRDKALLNFVEQKRKQGNFSAYVRELIKKDMDNQSNTELDDIYQYVRDRLLKEGFAATNGNNSNTNIQINETDKEVILELF